MNVIKNKKLSNAECCKRYQRKHSEAINQKRRERYREMVIALKLIQSKKESML